MAVGVTGLGEASDDEAVVFVCLRSLMIATSTWQRVFDKAQSLNDQISEYITDFFSTMPFESSRCGSQSFVIAGSEGVVLFKLDMKMNVCLTLLINL